MTEFMGTITKTIHEYKLFDILIFVIIDKIPVFINNTNKYLINKICVNYVKHGK